MGLGCATHVAPAPPIREVGSGPQPTGLLHPRQISDILDASPIAYAIVEHPGVEPQWLAAVLEVPALDPDPVDPFYVVERDGDGAPRLTHAPPPAEIRESFDQAVDAFESERFEDAAELFEGVVEAAPGYFKGHTNLGRAAQLAGDLSLARASLSHALELNPHDYQAYLFLADVLVELDELEGAKRALVSAYALNRTNPAVGVRLERVLPLLDLRLRPPALSPALQIRRSGEDRVEVAVAPGEGDRWGALGMCLACWAFERRCSQRASRDTDPLALTMYRECLLNHVAASDHAQRLYEAIADGYMEAIVFWEIIAVRVPAVVFLLPEPLRDDIEAYISEYAFASTRVVQRSPALLDKPGGHFDVLAP